LKYSLDHTSISAHFVWTTMTFLAYKKRTLLKQEMYLIKLWILITDCKFGKSTTVRPKSLVHFLYRAKLYKNGQDFLDIQYVLYVWTMEKICIATYILDKMNTISDNIFIKMLKVLCAPCIESKFNIMCSMKIGHVSETI